MIHVTVSYQCPQCSGALRPFMSRPKPHLEPRERWRCGPCKNHFSLARVNGEPNPGRRLSRSVRTDVVRLLMEGVSLAAIVRLADISPRTLNKLQKKLTTTCRSIHDDLVRDLYPGRVQADECWTKVRRARWPRPDAEAGHGAAWVWVALDQDARILISWHVGKRDMDSARAFLTDLKARCHGGFQLITDGCFMYPHAVEEVFVETGVHHTVLNSDFNRDLRYSAYAHRKNGHTTNHVERLNGDMRSRLATMRRHSRTYARSFDTLSRSIAIYAVHYNFVRAQKGGATAAMLAGVAERPWTPDDIVQRMEAHEGPVRVPPPPTWTDERRAKQRATWDARIALRERLAQ